MDDKYNLIKADLAIYDIPDDQDSNSIFIQDGREESAIITINGLTSKTSAEPMICISLPISSNDTEKKTSTIIEGLKKDILELANEFDIEIVITEQPAYNAANIKEQFPFYIHAIGFQSNIMSCEPHLSNVVKLYMARQNGKETFAEYLDIDSYSLLPICIGVDMGNIKHISTTYKTNVHIPSLTSIPHDSKFSPQIVLSGPIHTMVLQAKEAINQYIQDAKGNLFYKRFSGVSPGKLLYIKKYYQRELNQLMIKYESFIKITTEYIEFQSPNTSLLDYVVKQFTINILHNIVEIQISMKDSFSFTKESVSEMLSIDNTKQIISMQVPNLSNQLVLIGKHTTVMTKYNKKQKEVCSINKYLMILFQDQNLKSSLVQLRAIFEIHPDYEEFISGKKNGKLTRIMESSTCLLKLEMFENDDNMFLTLISDSVEEFLNAFSQFIDELPAEESFFIPEVYHRPVIGAGGSLIQTTMRKHNVFIQFSNSFLLPQNKFSLTRYDNVIIRCPRKNEFGIKMAEKELNQLAKEYGTLQLRTLIKFTPGQYRHLLADDTSIISQLEKNNNVFIDFPFEEPQEGYLLEIKGNNDNSLQAANILISTRFGAEMEIILNKEILDIANFYNSIVIPFKRSINIEVTTSDKLVRLTYNKDNKLIDKSIELLNEFLKSEKIEIASKSIIDEFIVESNGANSNDSNIVRSSNEQSRIQYPYYKYGYGYEYRS